MSAASPVPQPDAVAAPPSTPCLTYFVSDSNPGADSDNCAEPSTAGQRFSLQFGRGFATRSGVLGRFDGLLVDYRLSGDAIAPANIKDCKAAVGWVLPGP